MNKPQDFDQYWKKVEDELASIQPAAERTELHLRSAPEAKVYGLKLTSLDHYRIFAYFCVPSGKGPFPVIYRLPNYGSVVHIPPFEERCKYISVALCHRGQRLSDQPFAAKYPGLLTSGIDSQRNYIYRSIVADCLRVMDYLVSCDDVDSQKISLVGGDLALFTAALRDSASVLFYTPSLFYKALHKATATQNYPLEEFNDYLRSFPESIDQISQTLAYFEPMNFASRVKSEVMLMEESEGDANDLAVSFAREIERSGSKHSSYKDGVVLAEWLSKKLQTGETLVPMHWR
jgi:cephalosporin-C deacetylase|tara:strand:+ start:1053 stop:1922 length:870 start_codon:yes stop_codon:yes gene_type:complete